VAKPQQRRARRARHELQHLPPVAVVHLLEHLPEHRNRVVFLLVVADRVDAAILRVAAEVLDVDFARVAADQGLQLALVEHRQPHRLDDLAKPFQEVVGDELGLPLQAVLGDEEDVGEAIGVCYRNVRTAGLEVSGDRVEGFDTVAVLDRDRVADCEVE
jgi:hypothetical protein